MSKPPVIPIICGPTASGKTSAALDLAETIDIEIISADSRQIIKQLDIGTAKPTPEEQALVPFHLIDIIEPGGRYSAFQFISDANRVIGEILERGKIPVVVGGTGLYLQALTEGVVEIQEEDMKLRDRLEREMEELGAEEMYEKLQKIDPLEAVKIHPNNKPRIIRALEIYYLTGKPKSELVVTGAYRKSEYEFEYFYLNPPREKLYEIINNRVETMLEDGWLKEIENLVAEGLKDNLQKANVIGYNELLDYLDGELSYSDAVLFIKQNTRRYAKRQVTWFRRLGECRTFSDRTGLVKNLKGFLSEKRN